MSGREGAVWARDRRSGRRTAERERSEEDGQRDDEHHHMSEEDTGAEEGKRRQRGEVQRAPLHHRVSFNASLDRAIPSCLAAALIEP